MHRVAIAQEEREDGRVRYPRDPYNAWQVLREVNDVAFIAGGMARWMRRGIQHGGDDPSDIDLYMYRNDPADMAALVYSLSAMGYTQFATEGMAIAYRHPARPVRVQVINPVENQWYKTFGTPEEVLACFDFTVCMFAVGVDELNAGFDYVMGDEAEADAEARVLKINRVTHPVSAMARLNKYGRKGYRVSWNEARRIMAEWDKRPAEYRAEWLAMEFPELEPMEVQGYGGQTAETQTVEVDTGGVTRAARYTVTATTFADGLTTTIGGARFADYPDRWMYRPDGIEADRIQPAQPAPQLPPLNIGGNTAYLFTDELITRLDPDIRAVAEALRQRRADEALRRGMAQYRHGDPITAGPPLTFTMTITEERAREMVLPVGMNLHQVIVLPEEVAPVDLLDVIYNPDTRTYTLRYRPLT